MKGIVEGHVTTVTGQFQTNSFTVAFGPSNIHAWMSLTAISIAGDPDHMQALSGISLITTTGGSETFPFPSWLQSAFRQKCTSITFNLNVAIAGDGASARARFAVSFW